MSRVKTASKYLLAIFMIGAGTMHFVRTDWRYLGGTRSVRSAALHALRRGPK